MFIVALYLALNVVVVGVALHEVFTHGMLIDSWWSGLMTQHGSPWMAIGIALILFPKLALGLSGFETGVLVLMTSAAVAVTIAHWGGRTSPLLRLL